MAGRVARCQVALSLQPLLQGLAKGLDDLDTGVVLVIGLDQVPGGVFRAGTLDHVIDCSLVVLPALTVPVVFSGDFILLVARGLTLLEALQLFVFADMQPEFPDSTGFCGNGLSPSRFY